jgi:hypothetical protein
VFSFPLERQYRLTVGLSRARSVAERVGSNPVLGGSSLKCQLFHIKVVHMPLHCTFKLLLRKIRLSRGQLRYHIAEFLNSLLSKNDSAIKCRSGATDKYNEAIWNKGELSYEKIELLPKNWTGA